MFHICSNIRNTLFPCLKHFVSPMETKCFSKRCDSETTLFTGVYGKIMRYNEPKIWKLCIVRLQIYATIHSVIYYISTCYIEICIVATFLKNFCLND